MSTLLVSAAGGHLKQLHRLRGRLHFIDDDVTWVTFDTPQARSLLAGEKVVFCHRQEPRDYRGLLQNSHFAHRFFRDRMFNHVVSTGSGVALAFLPEAAARGSSCHYIESATRATHPSLTGRALRWVPGVRTYTQYPARAHGVWRYGGSVFDGFAADTAQQGEIRRAVVTVGTLAKHSFPRMLHRAYEVLPRHVDTLWQTGPITLDDDHIASSHYLASSDLDRAMATADVVISHAGTGSALAALEAGKCPVLVARRKAYGEHVDDHQAEVAKMLADRGLAISCSVEELSLDLMERAARRRISVVEEPPPFILD